MSTDNHRLQNLSAPPASGTREEPARVRGMFSAIAARYDLANTLLSGGCDFLWRRRAARHVQGWNPARLLDVATGSGALALTLARACPHTRIVGVDFCPPMLRRARARGVARLAAADAMQLPFPDGIFDALTVAFGLRNMAVWSGALREMRRVLRPGGHLLVLDFSMPQTWWRGAYRFYLHRCLPRIAGAVAGERDAYEYLAESIEQFPSGAAMLALLADCGFREAKAESLTGGIVSLYTAATPSRREDCNSPSSSPPPPPAGE